jgi:PKD domain-containing protein
MTRFLLASLATLCGVAGAAPPVVPVWLQPANVAAPQESVRFPSVAVSAAGDLLVLYGGTSGVEAMWNGGGGNGGAWTQLAGCGGNPQVGFDASGNAVAIWEECGSGADRLMTATRAPGLNGTWGTPVALSTPGRPAFEPRLSVNGHGDAVASWAEWADEFEVIQAATRSGSTGAWEPAVQISSTGAWAYESVSAIDERGDVAVAFTRSDPAGPIVWCAYRPAGRGWLASVQLSQPGNYGVDPDVALDREGNTIAVWNENGRGRSSYRSRATGAWEAPMSYPSNSLTHLATDSHGNAIAAWSDDASVWVSERPAGPGTAWMSPARVAAVAGAVDVHAAFDDADGAVVLWDRWASELRGTISAARRQAGVSSWTAPTSLEDVSAEMDWVRFAVDDVGDAVAVWEDYAWPRGVRSAILDSAAPSVATLTVPGRAKAGRAVRCAAAFHDLSRTTLRWQFGDGKRSTGSSVRHVYRRPGYYRVRLTATDAAGHVTSTSHPIRVVR